MEPFTLATTAITLATPYLLKTGEAIAEKIGEDIWQWIKKPFQQKDSAFLLDLSDEVNIEALKTALIEEIKADPTYHQFLESAVVSGQQMITNSQTINNLGDIEKQINISNNSGNIQM